MKPDRIVTMAAGFYSALALIALLWGWLRDLTPLWWRYPDVSATPGGAALIGLALGLLGVGLSGLMEAKVEGVQKLGERFGMVLAGVEVKHALALAALSSVGEELLFRGCVQAEFGLLPATILFALVHVGGQRFYLWWTASAFVFGLGLGALFELQGGLLGPIVMHFVINAINITMLARKEAARHADSRPRPGGLEPLEGP